MKGKNQCKQPAKKGTASECRVVSRGARAYFFLADREQAALEVYGYRQNCFFFQKQKQKTKLENQSIRYQKGLHAARIVCS